MTTTTKQTAANNAALAAIKGYFNAPVYEQVDQETETMSRFAGSIAEIQDSVSTEDDPDGYMSCCSDLGKLASSEEYDDWLVGMLLSSEVKPFTPSQDDRMEASQILNESIPVVPSMIVPVNLVLGHTDAMLVVAEGRASVRPTVCGAGLTADERCEVHGAFETELRAIRRYSNTVPIADAIAKADRVAAEQLRIVLDYRVWKQIGSESLAAKGVRIQDARQL